MKIFKPQFLVVIFSILTINVSAQTEDPTVFFFGHSLINHVFQINPTPSQETTVPHWMHYLAEEAGRSLKVGGQFGFLPQHANLPPTSQWGFDVVSPAWESDYDPFSEANFTDIVLTPGNFMQWQAPEAFYPTENGISPVSATIDIIEWCASQEPNMNYYIYENWPDMAEYLGSGFPPNENEWQNYNNYLQGDFVEWFDDYHNQVRAAHPDKCVKMIPVGRLISQLLQTSPFDQIAISELYEDDAPHGRPTIYFLASMITYMAIYESQAPLTYQPTDFIDPVVANNYELVNNFFWEALLDYNNGIGESVVFCDIEVSVDEGIFEQANYEIYPNPTGSEFYISNLEGKAQVDIYNSIGVLLKTVDTFNATDVISVAELPVGVYVIKIFAYDFKHDQFCKLVKQ